MPLILSNPSEFELIEKKSRFIGHAFNISSEDEAKDIISKIRHKHNSANHNCFAYSIGSITRASDDGEPSGTAGMPILNVYQKSDVINFLCVVTRYFGGIMLGAGGLIRAYTKSAKGAMDEANPMEQIIYHTFEIKIPYSNHDKVKHQFKKTGIEILNAEFTDIVTMTVRVKDADLLTFTNMQLI